MDKDNLITDLYTISRVLSIANETPECLQPLTDAYSIGQIKSKLWLIENLPPDLGMVFICAGWYGTLANLMFDNCRYKFDKIRSFDVDPSCYEIADTINRPWVIDGWQFKSSTLDIHDMKYPTTHRTYRANGTHLDLTEMPDTIINTSCEHINNFDEWYSKIPKGKMIVLQSNNYFEIAEHINCSHSLSEFIDSAPMSNIIYQGTLSLDKYDRYMVIGIK